MKIEKKTTASQTISVPFTFVIFQTEHTVLANYVFGQYGFLTIELRTRPFQKICFWFTAIELWTIGQLLGSNGFLTIELRTHTY